MGTWRKKMFSVRSLAFDQGWKNRHLLLSICTLKSSSNSWKVYLEESTNFSIPYPWRIMSQGQSNNTLKVFFLFLPKHPWGYFIFVPVRLHIFKCNLTIISQAYYKTRNARTWKNGIRNTGGTMEHPRTPAEHSRTMESYKAKNNCSAF